MFRYTFALTYTDKNGCEVKDTGEVVINSDNIFAARAEYTYRLSRNHNVFAPFDFEVIKIESWGNGKWREEAL